MHVWIGRHDNKEYMKDQDSLDENDAMIFNTPKNEKIYLCSLSLSPSLVGIDMSIVL